MNNPSTHGIQSARVDGLVSVEAGGGTTLEVPVGPCLIERLDQQRVEIIWGPSGEHSAVLPLDALLSAERRGALVMLN